MTRAAATFAWLLLAVGIIRIALVIPLLVQQASQLLSTSQPIYLLLRTAVSDIFYVMESVAVSFVIFMLLKDRGHSISPFSDTQRA